ncbi:MAG: hypothetical protein ABI253_03905 [Mycobacterium sp.]
MTSLASSAMGPAQSFGYHPDPEQLSVALDCGDFARALILDGPVRALASRVKECRVLGRPDVELPEGLYWFQGVDGGALILQVALGAPPGDATVAPLDQLSDDHPLMAAFAWAEKFWLVESAAIGSPTSTSYCSTRCGSSSRCGPRAVACSCIRCTPATAPRPSRPLYGARKRGIGIDEALRDVREVLPDANPDGDLRAALRRLAGLS